MPSTENDYCLDDVELLLEVWVFIVFVILRLEISLAHVFNRKSVYDGKHPTARFSVSAGDKIENFMTMKIKDNIQRIISVYHSEYFIAKFAFK